ncbi:hypothetical protein GCM10010420_36600 [Streptomyces glaucosporus]|uniref:Uncharacterized protein n=1 Tax=Streptomyces glaucosporus TaxID=284044 RepID=A0ABP5VK85_9ACTN
MPAPRPGRRRRMSENPPTPRLRRSFDSAEEDPEPARNPDHDHEFHLATGGNPPLIHRKPSLLNRRHPPGDADGTRLPAPERYSVQGGSGAGAGAARRHIRRRALSPLRVSTSLYEDSPA